MQFHGLFLFIYVILFGFASNVMNRTRFVCVGWFGNYVFFKNHCIEYRGPHIRVALIRYPWCETKLVKFFIDFPEQVVIDQEPWALTVLKSKFSANGQRSENPVAQ